MQGPGVELETDDCENEDGEHDQQADLHQRGEGLENWLKDDLETCDENDSY